MKNRLFTVILVLSITMSLFPLSGCRKEESPTADYVTRGEWISMLADTFALDSYNSATPFYSDVTASSDLFPFVQSAAEWKILSIYTGDTLAPDTPVSRDEVASTAAVAAGFWEGGGQANQAGSFDVEASIEFASQYGIVPVGEANTQYMTIRECEAAIRAAQAVYMESPGEETLIAVTNPELVNLSSLSPTYIQTDGEKVVVSDAAVDRVTRDDTGNLIAVIHTEAGAVEVRVGTTFVTAPTTQRPWGIAYRVATIAESDNGEITFTTQTPDLGDIYDELDIHTTVSLEDGAVIWADGVHATPAPAAVNELSANGMNYHLELLSGSSDGQATHKLGQKGHIELRGGAVPVFDRGNPTTVKDGKAAQALESSGFTYTDTPSVEDFHGSTASWSEQLQKTSKFSGGYTIEGDISLDLQVTTDVEYHKLNILWGEIQTWPERASLIVDAKIATSLKFEGTLEDELELGTITIPLGLTGLSVEGTLLLYAEANGSIQVKVEFQNVQRVEWADPAGFRHQSPINKATPDMQATVDLSFGAGVSLSLCAASIKIIGADVRIGGELATTGSVVGRCEEQTVENVTTRTYTEAIKLDSTFYLPIVTLSASGPEHLSEVFGWEKSWEIIGRDKATPVSILDKEWPFWSKTVTLDENGEVMENEKTTLELDMDFSAYAGTYRPYTSLQGETATNLILDADGAIWGESGYSGGGISFSDSLEGSGTIPISVDPQSDGSYVCTLFQDEDWNDGNEWHTGGACTYTIYPPDVGLDPIYSDVSWFHDYEDQVRIRYLDTTGGVMDIFYVKQQ